jgi:hypothetical protein
MPLRPLEQRLSELAERLERVEALTARQSRELEIQFQRIAQLQAELDMKRTATESVRLYIDSLPTESE